MTRSASLFTAILCLVLLSACSASSSRGTQVPTGGDAAPLTNLANLPLPDPAVLRKISFNEADMQINGGVHPLAPVLLPAYYQNVSTGGAVATYTPSWGPGNRNPAALAFALYGFAGAGDFDRDKTIRLNWSQHQGRDKVFVGVANWASERWDWYNCDADGIAALDESRFADYQGEPMPGFAGLGFLVVVLDDGGPWVLDSCRLGEPPPQEAPQITGVTVDTGEEGATGVAIGAINAGGSGSIEWSFGGGITPASSTVASPLIDLGAPGIVPCSVTITNAAGSDQFDFNFTITPALLPPDITMAFPTTGDSGDLMQATALNAGGSVVSWEWDFGGGATPDTSTEASPEITLGAAGLYNCSVLAVNSAGQDLFNFQLQVSPGGGSAPQVVSVLPLNGASGAGVVFDTVVTGFVNDYEWDFGGGATPNTSTLDTPLVTLGAPGIYNCTLAVSNDFGSDVFDFQLQVTAALNPPNITAISPLGGTQFAVTQFTATNTGGPVDTWEWDFGTAGTPNTSSAESPTITLGGAGPIPHTISVTATNAAGTSFFQITNFTINPPF